MFDQHFALLMEVQVKPRDAPKGVFTLFLLVKYYKALYQPLCPTVASKSVHI